MRCIWPRRPGSYGHVRLRSPYQHCCLPPTVLRGCRTTNRLRPFHLYHRPPPPSSHIFGSSDSDETLHTSNHQVLPLSFQWFSLMPSSRLLVQAHRSTWGLCVGRCCGANTASPQQLSFRGVVGCFGNPSSLILLSGVGGTQHRLRPQADTKLYLARARHPPTHTHAHANTQTEIMDSAESWRGPWFAPPSLQFPLLASTNDRRRPFPFGFRSSFSDGITMVGSRFIIRAF